MQTTRFALRQRLHAATLGVRRNADPARCEAEMELWAVVNQDRQDKLLAALAALGGTYTYRLVDYTPDGVPRATSVLALAAELDAPNVVATLWLMAVEAAGGDEAVARAVLDRSRGTLAGGARPLSAAEIAIDTSSRRALTELSRARLFGAAGEARVAAVLAEE